MTAIIAIDAMLIMLLLCLLGVKTFHFAKSIKHKRIMNWFYFSHYNIVLSSSSQSAEAKKKQNAYTLGISVLLLTIGFTAYIEMLLLK